MPPWPQVARHSERCLECCFVVSALRSCREESPYAETARKARRKMHVCGSQERAGKGSVAVSIGAHMERDRSQCFACETWCPDCSCKGRVRQKRGLQDLRRHAGSRGGRCLATRFSTVLVKVLWQCSKGHVWQATPNKVLNAGSWCPICGGTAPVGLEPLRRHAANLGGECLATEYNNSRVKLRWRCRSGHEWLATASSVRRGSWCPECRNASRRIGLERLRAHAASLGGKCLAKTYRNNKQRLPWECKERHRWKTTAAHVLVDNSWCPQCMAWRTETEVRNIFELLLNPAKFVSSRPKFLGGLELDGYCEETSLAFEYQGEQHYDPDNYFHFGSPSSFRMQQDRDARKRELCEDFGVRLVVIPFFAKDKKRTL